MDEGDKKRNTTLLFQAQYLLSCWPKKILYIQNSAATNQNQRGNKKTLQHNCVQCLNTFLKSTTLSQSLRRREEEPCVSAALPSADLSARSTLQL